MKFFDRIHGCLAGLALGDALGNPSEFMNPDQIRSEFGWIDHFVPAPVWHPHHILAPGQITDDTGQVLAVAHAYGEDGSLTADSVARHLILWADQAGDALPVILGPSTRQALEKLRSGASPQETGEKGTTNGAAYRAIVVGLVNYNQTEKLLSQVVETCLPTHGTSVAISGAAAVGYAISAAMKSENRVEEIISAACCGATKGRNFGKWHWGTPLEKRIELACSLIDKSLSAGQALEDLYSYVGVDMLVAESVATAIGLVKLANGNPMKAVRYGANIGGDTDTIAAIAGAICGAYSGIDAFDADMIKQLEIVNHFDLKQEAARIESIIHNRKASHDQ
jgi:ADP-ribosylglycohydrolase